MQTYANERFDVSRGNGSIWRPLTVWAIVTTAAGAAAGAAPGAWASARRTTGPDAVTDLVVAVCATGLALALAWLWVITTTTVAGVLNGTVSAGGGATRRLVLVACGAAALAGAGVPALAAGGDGSELLVGLPLPERAVAPPQRAIAPSPPPTVAGVQVVADGAYVVRRGDSLWSIARLHPGDSASVDQRWRAIWQANRDVVGDDPDLILPGQALHLPDGAPHHNAQHKAQDNADGDR